MKDRAQNLSDKQKLILRGRICPYCGKSTYLVDSEIVYGKSYGKIYLCRDCWAYVGVHKGTDKALGRLANHELRKAKNKAHFYFDKIWNLGYMTRKEAYSWLSQKLNISEEYTHIGMFSVDTCNEVVELSKQFLNDERRLDLDFGIEPKTPYYE